MNIIEKQILRLSRRDEAVKLFPLANHVTVTYNPYSLFVTVFLRGKTLLFLINAIAAEDICIA